MHTRAASKLIIAKDLLGSGQVSWRSPSNIALVKYWGKYGTQLPKNPSISFTLSAAFTETTVQYEPRTDFSGPISMSFLFDGQIMPAFAQRISEYLIRLIPTLPFIEQLHFHVSSRNSFPHSAGIASSAAGLSALALCLCSIEDQFFETLQEDQPFRTKASRLARLGSGSACRSIYSRAALWGKTGLVDDAHNEYAIPFGPYLHPAFEGYQDAILLVSNTQKSVSSSAGHALMETHPYAGVRYDQARRNLQEMIECLKHGHLDRFSVLCENEAMQLHALMMSSQPNYLLMRPGTISIIEEVRAFRSDTEIPLCFTLDAGPNVHLLYPKAENEAVENFIGDTLVKYCHQGAWIKDEMGLGPLQID